MSQQKFKKDIVFIVIFLLNVTTNVSNSTEMRNCKKRKLFGMSRQCRTPSEVAHVIRTLSVQFPFIYSNISIPIKYGKSIYRRQGDKSHEHNSRMRLKPDGSKIWSPCLRYTF